MSQSIILLDPTAETAPAKRQRKTPPETLEGLTVGLLDIGKARGDEFIDRVAELMAGRGIEVRRYAKPTNTKTAPLELLQAITMECDLVVEALSD